MEKVKGIIVKMTNFLASNHKSFTVPSNKMLDSNEIKYFVYFEDLFSFCIFGIYERTALSYTKYKEL